MNSASLHGSGQRSGKIAGTGLQNRAELVDITGLQRGVDSVREIAHSFSCCLQLLVRFVDLRGNIAERRSRRLERTCQIGVERLQFIGSSLEVLDERLDVGL